MSRTTETDLLARCLSGDYQSRVQLYRQFVHGDPRVRRHGAHYSSLSDFLHDCFANVMHAGHSLLTHHALAERVEWIAASTALERDRLRNLDLSGETRRIRMCAAIEGDAPGNRISSYVPPRSAEPESLHSRLSAVCGDVPFLLIRTQALENPTWEDLAAAVSKPLNFVGPALVRGIDRLTRLFGAPPPLNADFEPIFAEVSAKDVRSRNTGKGQPRGRAIAMHLDPEFYQVTPDLRKLGLTVPSDVRILTLWDAARSAEPPGAALRDHLTRCRYCSEVFRAILLLHQAVCSPAGADFLLCPGASTLLMDPEEAGEACRQHLLECDACRHERTEALGLPELFPAPVPQAAAASGSWKKITAWGIAALVVVASVLVVALRHSPSHGTSASSSAAAGALSVTPESKYLKLLQNVKVTSSKLMPSVLQVNQFNMMEAVNALAVGNIVKAKVMSEQAVNVSNDPGARLLLAICLYEERRFAEGYREMQASEATLPRNPFRCWTLLQCALLANDTTVVEREVGHLAGDPEYGSQAQKILVEMRAVK
jgi:hypothetical protein